MKDGQVYNGGLYWACNGTICRRDIKLSQLWAVTVWTLLQISAMSMVTEWMRFGKIESATKDGTRFK